MSSEKIIPNYEDATIANGATNSGWVDLKGKQLVAVVFPAAFTGTSPSVKFRARVDGGSGNFIEQKESTTDYSLPVALGGWVPVPVEVFCGAAQLQIVASATQLASRTIRLITRPVN